MPFDEEELDPHGECRHEIEILRSALMPFAKLAEAYPTFDGKLTFGFGDTVVTLAECRRARDVLVH